MRGISPVPTRTYTKFCLEKFKVQGSKFKVQSSKFKVRSAPLFMLLERANGS
jgi:hypothetical protein